MVEHENNRVSEEEDLYCLSVHAPTIPSKFVTLFQQKQNNVGFGTSINRGLVDENSQLEKQLKMSAEEYMSQEEQYPHCGHRTRLPALRPKPTNERQKETYFRYIFVGKSAQVKAKVAPNGSIEYDDGPCRRRSKPPIVQPGTLGRAKLPATSFQPDLTLSTEGTTNNEINNKSISNNPILKVYSELTAKTSSSCMPVRGPSASASTRLNDYLTAKKVALQKYLDNISEQHVAEEISTGYDIFEQKDLKSLVRRLQKEANFEPKRPTLCQREQILLSHFNEPRVGRMARREHFSKKCYRYPVPGPGHYDNPQFGENKSEHISGKGTAPFASNIKKLPPATISQTNALYNPQLPPKQISHAFSDGKFWIK